MTPLRSKFDEFRNALCDLASTVEDAIFEKQQSGMLFEKLDGELDIIFYSMSDAVKTGLLL